MDGCRNRPDENYTMDSVTVPILPKPKKPLAADMDIRYEKVFSIVDIQQENMKKWESILPFYQNIQKEGLVLWRAA